MATIIQIPEDKKRSKQQSQQPSLVEKLREHYLYGGGTTGGSRSANSARALFLLQAATQIYVTVNVLMPFVFEDCHPWIVYCLQVWACYMCAMGVANWVCVLCYGNVYKPTRDRPDINLNIYTNGPPERFVGNLALDPHHQGNGHVTVDITEKGGLPWKYCGQCDMSIPPRAHHCKFCNRCILRRDHHCFMVGTCIGHWNQRYFVVLAGYVMVVGYVGAFLTITYLRYHPPAHFVWWDYFLPVAFYQWVKGYIDGLTMLLIYHAHMLCIFGPVANLYFLSQLSIIAQGKTMYEVSKKKNYKITSSVEDNIRLVFGEYWMVNFLFPAQILFKQTNQGLHYEGVKMGPAEVESARQNNVTYKKLAAD
ncbi:hypothetical protein ACOMHN_059247 [Nucella lapillus]